MGDFPPRLQNLKEKMRNANFLQKILSLQSLQSLESLQSL